VKDFAAQEARETRDRGKWVENKKWLRGVERLV